MEWGILITGIYLLGMAAMFVMGLTMDNTEKTDVVDQTEQPTTEPVTEKKAA